MSHDGGSLAGEWWGHSGAGEWSDSGHGPDHAHGPSFADAFVGVALAAGLTGHSVSVADTAAAAIAIEVALDHGGPGELHGHETGYLHEVPALAGPSWSGPQVGWHAPEGGASVSGMGRQLHLPGIARDATTVDVLFWPHGWCGSTYRGVQEEIRQLAKREGMVRFDSTDIKISYLKEIDRTEHGILPIVGSDSVKHLPNGWYRGATGATHQWREFFGIPRSWLLPAFLVSDSDYTVMGGPEINLGPRIWVPRTILIVTGSTWWYAQTADYETRVAFSLHAETWFDGRKQYNWRQIKQYRKRAERLAQRLRDYLQAHPAPPTSIDLRRQMGPEATKPE